MSLHQNKQALLPLLLFQMKYCAVPDFLLPLGQSLPTFIVSAQGDKDKENAGAMLMQLHMTDWTTSAKIDLPVTPSSPLMSCCFFKET